MKIIGCDFHPSFQQIAMADTETGEYMQKKLTPAEAEQFYSQLQGEVVVGAEASGNMLWFERLLARLGHRLRLGDGSQIQAREVRKQKTDQRAAELILQLLLEDQFPEIWVPSLQQRDLRQLLVHRHKLVGMRRQVKNQLQHLAMNQGLQLKHRLWTQKGRQRLEDLALSGWTARRREDGLRWLDQLNRDLAELDVAVEKEAQQNAVAQLLETHPGVGPITSLAFVLTLGEIERFPRSRNLVSYLGLNPSEHSSGARRRYGAISKQGNPMLRRLLVEAGQSASRVDMELKRA